MTGLQPIISTNNARKTVIRVTNPSKVTTRRRTSSLQSTDTLSRLSLITCYDSDSATDLPMAA